MVSKKVNKVSNLNNYSLSEGYLDNTGVNSIDQPNIYDVFLLKQHILVFLRLKWGGPESFLVKFEILQDERFTSEVLARAAVEN